MRRRDSCPHKLLMGALLVTVAALGAPSTATAITDPDGVYLFQTFHSGWEGAETGDAYGGALAIGDFDGDGYLDLAVGAAGEDHHGQTNEGMVNIVPGSAAGPDFSRLYSLDPEGNRDDDYDHFGKSMVAGDFNRDGVADLAVGTPDEDVSGDVEVGYVGIYYGQAGVGLVRRQGFFQDNISPGGNPEYSDYFGESLTSGDFDGDGVADLAIGTPGEDSGMGWVVVLFGVPDPDPGDAAWAGGLDLANGVGKNQAWFQDQAFASTSREYSDEFGAALTSGNLNGDISDLGFPIDDLIITTLGEDIGSVWEAGYVGVLYGKELGPGEAGFGAGSQAFSQADAGLGQNEEADFFGEALATGDFDGDGYDDLAIGTPREDVGAEADAGVVGVLYGSPGGLLLGQGQVFDQFLAGLGETEAGDAFGAALSAGNFLGDWRDDLVIGAPAEDVDTEGGEVGDAGEAGTLYGGFVNGRSACPRLDLTNADVPSIPRDLILWEGRRFDQGDLGDDVAASDGFGRAFAAADLDGDGWDEVVIGVPLEDWGSPDAGVVHVGTPWPRPSCGRQLATIFGTGEDDLLVGTPGRDVIVGLGGDDDIVGYGGNDLICGGPGDDVIAGGDGRDRIYGNEGNDEIYGDAGADRLFGGPGFDTLDGGPGDDLIKGGPNGDFIVSGPGADTVKAGNGADTISYEWASGGVVVSLADRTATGADSDNVAGVEHVEGSLFDDVLAGSPANNTLWGLDGDDTLNGAAGNDLLLGGPGTDSAKGGIGTDTCEAETNTGCEK